VSWPHPRHLCFLDGFFSQIDNLPSTSSFLTCVHICCVYTGTGRESCSLMSPFFSLCRHLALEWNRLNSVSASLERGPRLEEEEEEEEEERRKKKKFCRRRKRTTNADDERNRFERRRGKGPLPRREQSNIYCSLGQRREIRDPKA
jgi:hypothetical protein